MAKLQDRSHAQGLAMPEQVRARIPGFETRVAAVGGLQIAYWIGGDPAGIPVLLWHGFLGSRFSWHRVMPLLAEAGYRVLAPDMRGYGDSTKPAGTAGYDGRTLAGDFHQLTKEIGFGDGRPLFIIAHDMGAPPALLWAADHPEEVAGLMYLEVPVMLSGVLSKIIAYTPEAMRNGSMWWWILPLAQGVPERLVVGHERAFLTWFYERDTAEPGAISPEAVGEYLRTFSGVEGVLGAMGVYRAAFETIAQTEPLTERKVTVPVAAFGGDKSLGGNVQQMVARVAENVTGGVFAGCGHFIPEEVPEELVGRFEEFAARVAGD